MSVDGADDPLEDGWILPNKDGSFSLEFKMPDKGVVARWNERTSEMTLERQEDGAIVLATRSPDAFYAGVQLLRSDRVVTWLGFVLAPRIGAYVVRQEP